MRDRLGDLPATGSKKTSNTPASSSDPIDEAISALIGLGYKPQEASKFVLAIASDNMSSEELIREALKNSVKK
jgi:Holliday junction DNA helicase RuvA